MSTTLPRGSAELITLAALFLALMLTVPARADAPPLAGKRVLFMGDSITQHGRYITLMEYYLDKRFPHSQFDFSASAYPVRPCPA